MRSKHVLLLLGLGMLLCSACVPLGGEWYIDIKMTALKKSWLQPAAKREPSDLPNHRVPGTRRFILTKSITRTKRSYTQPYHLMVLDDNALLAIFIISPEVYENYSWKEIGEKEMFLKKYVFRYGDMRTKYPITYPKDYD